MDLVEQIARVIEPEAWRWKDRDKYMDTYRHTLAESLEKARKAIDLVEGN